VEDESILYVRWAGNYQHRTGPAGQYVCGGISESSADWPSGQTHPWQQSGCQQSTEVAISKEHMPKAGRMHEHALVWLFVTHSAVCAGPLLRTSVQRQLSWAGPF
jgi:hypothetical protein